MKIERILRDPNGTTVKLPGDVTYHFKPEEPGGPHVAEVEEHHCNLFLNHPEGYRRADGVAYVNPALLTNTTALVRPTTIEAAIALMEALGAEEAEYAAEVAWPDLFPLSPEDDTDPDNEGAGLPGEGAGPEAEDEAGEGTGEASEWAAKTDDELRAIFEQEVGRKPHHKAGRDTMIAQIEAARAGE